MWADRTCDNAVTGLPQTLSARRLARQQRFVRLHGLFTCPGLQTVRVHCEMASHNNVVGQSLAVLDTCN